jgi:hypothetical protein
MPLATQLEYGSNWSLFLEDSITATPALSGEGYLPIGEIMLPVRADKTTLAVYVTTINPKPRWYWGGSLIALVNTGLVTGGSPETVVASNPLQLGKINLIRLPALADTFGLKLVVPYWFKAISYTVWQYVGTGIGNLEGKVDAVYDKLENP